jgi:hypothetical protein
MRLPNPTPDHPRRPGRPRKYASDAERMRVFRSVHGLCKVTVDVPTQFAGELRDYARGLRRIASELPPKSDSKAEEAHIDAPNWMTPKQAVESYVMNMRWARVARGVHLLYRPPHWFDAEIIKLPPSLDPAGLLWSWHVTDRRSMRTIARGDAVNLGRANGMIVAVLTSYLEDKYYIAAGTALTGESVVPQRGGLDARLTPSDLARDGVQQRLSDYSRSREFAAAKS